MPEKRIRPRALTLTLPDRKQPTLLFNGRKYWLRNFSAEGIGVWMPTPPFPLHKGFKLKGDIEIGQEIHPVQLEVVHCSETIVGLHITDHSAELKTLFQRLLQPSVYASQLEPHGRSGELDATGFQREWWSGPGPSELLVWTAGEGLIRAVQVCWLGNWVYRELLQPVQTGELSESVPLTGQKLEPGTLLRTHDKPDAEMMRQAGQFLAASPSPLPGTLLWQFLETGDQIFLPRRKAA